MRSLRRFCSMQAGQCTSFSWHGRSELWLGLGGQMGKVIGGGLPVGAYGGRRDIMQLVAPAGGLPPQQR